jgi:hypothetical protein
MAWLIFLDLAFLDPVFLELANYAASGVPTAGRLTTASQH